MSACWSLLGSLKWFVVATATVQLEMWSDVTLLMVIDVGSSLSDVHLMCVP